MVAVYVRAKVIFVTDPMCSWCWGMAPDIERARREGAAEFDFDCVLGGINIGSTHPVSDFARARLADVWARVVSVTRAEFGDGLPRGDFVYNSTPACVAVEAMRELDGATPFDFLHRLQTRFFVDGVDIGNESVLIREAVAAGGDAERFVAAFQAPATMNARARRVRDREGVRHVGIAECAGRRRRQAWAGRGWLRRFADVVESVRGHLRRLAES